MHLIFFFVSFLFFDKELMVGEFLCRWTIQLSASEYFLFMLWLFTDAVAIIGPPRRHTAAVPPVRPRHPRHQELAVATRGKRGSTK